MMIDTSTVVSMTDANQNFSKVTRVVDQKGRAVIFKNNAPKYLVIEFSIANQSTLGNPVCPRFPGFSISLTSLNSSPNISRLLEILNNGVRGLAPSVSGW
jgi:antitoxin Phd